MHQPLRRQAVALLPLALWAFAAGAAGTAPPRERVDLRTPNSRTFETGPGRFRTEIYTFPVFYQDAQGRMRPIAAVWSHGDPAHLVAARNSLAAAVDATGVELRTPGGSALRIEPATLSAAVDELRPSTGAGDRIAALHRGHEVAAYTVFPGGIRMMQSRAGASGELARWNVDGEAIAAIGRDERSGALLLDLADGTRVAVRGFLVAAGRRSETAVETLPSSTSKLSLAIPASGGGLSNVIAAVEVTTLVASADSAYRYGRNGLTGFSLAGGAGRLGWTPYPFAGDSADIFRSYIRWDTSSIPDNATISNASFSLLNNSFTASAVSFQIFQMAADPNGIANPQTLFNDCGDGNLYAAYDLPWGSTQTITNNGGFNADLQSRLANNWMAVGLINANEASMSAYGELATFAPLTVSYTCPCATPGTPTSTAATATAAATIHLTWVDASSNEIDFLIERSTNGGAFTTLAKVGANATSYNDATVAGTNTYSYRLRAHNCSCYSLYSPTAVVPNAPSNLGASFLGGTQLRLNWTDASANENGFEVERKLGANGTWSRIATVGANVATYTDTAVPVGTDYYRVRAASGTGFSWYTNEVSWTQTPPLNVYITRAQVGATQVATAHVSGGSGSYTSYQWYRLNHCVACPVNPPLAIVAGKAASLAGAEAKDLQCGVWHGPDPSTTPPDQFTVYNGVNSDVEVVVADSSGKSSTAFDYACPGGGGGGPQ